MFNILCKYRKCLSFIVRNVFFFASLANTMVIFIQSFKFFSFFFVTFFSCLPLYIYASALLLKQYKFSGSCTADFILGYVEHVITRQCNGVNIYTNKNLYTNINLIDHTLSIWLEMEFTSDIFLKTSVCTDNS